MHDYSAPVNTIWLGGFTGEIDEFVLSSAFTSGLPAEPIKGNLDVNAIGGFGSGTLGNVTLNANCVMCSTGLFTGEVRDSAYRIEGITAGKFGTFKAGDEVLIHEQEYQDYCFRTITEISGNYFTFSAPLPNRHVSAVIQVPHFNTLTINSGVIVSPAGTPITSHGIVAFRVRNDCTINGSILTSGKGSPRTSPGWEASTNAKAMHHAKLPDCFVCGTGGGVFIACGGTLTASSSARIGASWSGSGTGGDANGGINSGGGAGYGGGSSGSGGKQGLVGWGGYSPTALDIGAGPGRNSYIPLEEINSSFTESTADHPYSGASVIIIAKRIRIDENAVSTGGENAVKNSSPEVSGAGAGYCYIACKEVRDHDIHDDAQQRECADRAEGFRELLRIRERNPQRYV